MTRKAQIVMNVDNMVYEVVEKLKAQFSWKSVAETTPQAELPVLAVVVVNESGARTITRAHYIPRHAVEVLSWEDDECNVDLDEATGVEYVPEGWYECPITTEYYKSLGKVTHWMELPIMPIKEEQPAITGE